MVIKLQFKWDLHIDHLCKMFYNVEFYPLRYMYVSLLGLKVGLRYLPAYDCLCYHLCMTLYDGY